MASTGDRACGQRRGAPCCAIGRRRRTSVLVVDSSSAVIPGANVTLKNLETNTSDSRVSNDEGYAIFSPIPRGTYDVEVALDRFQPVRLRNISVDVQQNRLLRVTMEVAPGDRGAGSHRTVRTGADGGGLSRSGHQGHGCRRITARGAPLQRSGAARAGRHQQRSEYRNPRPGLVHGERKLPHAEQLHPRRLR